MTVYDHGGFWHVGLLPLPGVDAQSRVLRNGGMAYGNMFRSATRVVVTSSCITF